MMCTPAVATPSAQQLITVVAPTARSTYATARIWTRGTDGCWKAVGGPYTARVGRNGIRTNKREGDGATPAGTFPIATTMYGYSPNPGVAFRYVRLRCGDWWVEDERSRAYNTFQRIGCGRAPPFKVVTPDLFASPRAYALRGRRIQHASSRTRSRFRNLPPRSDRKADERLHQFATPGADPRAPLAPAQRAP